MFDPKKMTQLEKEKEEWERGQLQESLRVKGERKKEFKTGSRAIKIDRLYTPLNLKDRDYLEDIGFPGRYPFTRGIDPTMYRGAIWGIGEYAGYGSAEESNRRYKYLLDHGQTSGVIIAMDLPTQIGYDSDHPLARGEVGRVGVAIDTLRDIEILFDGIPLNKAGRVFTTANAISPIMMAMVIALGKKQGVPLDSFTLNIQNDILKEFVARGTYIFPLKPSMKLSTDVMEWVVRHYPRWRSITVCGSHMRQAGANAVQEAAFAIANAIAYVESCLRRGLEMDRIGPTMTFQFTIPSDLFEEVAKFRAARRAWARVVKEKFRAQDPHAGAMSILSWNAGYTLTPQEPLNNIIRVTLQALAGVLGGVQFLHTSSYDEALATPTEESVKVALRTLQILAHEFELPNTVDPLGGSYFVESLTNQIESGVWEYLEKIDKMGGALRVIESGFYHKEIANCAYEYQKEVEAKERLILGVNLHPAKEKPNIRIHRVDPAVEEKQIASLNRVKKERNNEEVKRALARVEKAAQNEENLIPTLVEAVVAYATIGEICHTLRGVYGEQLQPVAIF